jgi:hypothetical protein
MPMVEPQSSKRPRDLSFEPTPAVVASRARSRYIVCPVCQVDNSQYLFHNVGVRFVRCRTCAMVYVNPASDTARNFFTIDGLGVFKNPKDRELCVADFERLLEQCERVHQRVRNASPERTLLIGRYLPDFAAGRTARRLGLKVATFDDPAFAAFALSSDLAPLTALLQERPQLVLLHEALEACADPSAVLEALIAALPESTLLAITFTNVQSMPAQLMRRYWPPLLGAKSAFFNTNNLIALMARFGFDLRSQFALPVRHTLDYIGSRVGAGSMLYRSIAATPLGNVHAPVRAGNRVAVFNHRTPISEHSEKLSIVFPVYNEAKSVQEVLDAVLAKQLKIAKEVIVVESNSSDGTREIVKSYEGRPDVRIIYEDRPRGKGHAVRTGLKAATGSIILIQDADFEYDIEDYDALLEPILQHRATFVLGSRSLGLNDWKVRKFARGAFKGMILNAAQVLFANTYNLLYQQRVTDVNTMFKVFRTEALESFDLESNGFELDIELACKLARHGNAPIEVPVNYVARGFDEGKKISFVRDSIPSYFAFFRYRV